MNFKLRLIALLLVVLMCFTSCDAVINIFMPTPSQPTASATTTKKPSTKPTTTKPEDDDSWKRAEHSTSIDELKAKYTLTQEEVDATLALLDNMLAASKTATAEDTTEFDAIYEQFEDKFYHMAEQNTIAMIIYYYNMSDDEATARKEEATEWFYDVQDKYNIICRDMYNESPIRDILFEGWTEDEIQSLMDYDPIVLEIRKEIDALEVEYNDLSSAEFDDRAAEIYAQIVVKNNELAAYFDYDNYYTYATENVYDREYTLDNLGRFKEYVIKYILPEFSGVYNRYAAIQKLSKEDKSVVTNFMDGKFDRSKDKNYLLEYLDSLGDTTMGKSMRHVFENKNCIFSGKINSHPTAFCTYLYESEVPFCLFGSSGQSAPTLAHEIGHYYQTLANNDLSSYDLLETHSQSNEFFFLEFCQPQLPATAFDVIYAYQLVNACYIIVMATIIDEFEQRVYALDSEVVANYKSEDFDAIMTEVCKAYGGADFVESELADPFNYWRQVTITNPVYYISYAVSAVAALEVNALLQEDSDAAYAAYITLVEGVTPEDGFVGALIKAGFTSPFEEDTYKAIAKVFD